jgi:MoxR-like ATPase
MATRIELQPQAGVDNVQDGAVVETVLEDVPVPTVARQ